MFFNPLTLINYKNAMENVALPLVLSRAKDEKSDKKKRVFHLEKVGLLADWAKLTYQVSYQEGKNNELQ